MKLEKILFFIILTTIFGGVIFGLVYLKQNNMHLRGLSTREEKSNLTSSQFVQKIIFYFRMREKRWIKKAANIFSKKKEITDNLPQNWIVLNFLNHYYPDWEKYHYITLKTLKKPIYKTNYIVFQPLIPWIEKKIRNIITIKDLENLNIAAKYIKTNDEEIDELLKLINDQTVSWEEIQLYIQRNFTAKYIPIVLRKIQENIHF